MVIGMVEPATAGLAPPPVPADVDLRDFRFMPFDVLTIRDGRLPLGDPAIFRATILLWFVAWHQLPAGSLDSDDEWLAKHSGAHADWPRIRDAVLAGFVAHDDGRLYHPIVTEKVLEAWGRKRAKQRAKEADCKRKAQAAARPCPRPRAEPPPEAEPAPEPEAAPPDAASVIYKQGLSWLVQASGRPDRPCRALLGKWRAALGDEALIALLGRAQREGAIDPVAWIEKAIAAHKAHHDPPQPQGWN